ncbi:MULTISPECIES: HAD family hydrolase [unclassified Pseudomonas]|uniref:HAD family hydrolase n=1 Tax=unclassified Pseudomonas TaxID=196821 RepID=UPI000EAA9A68|nr:MULTISPECIES: HAD family hydrolase [unclassified Pseudomonas]AYF89605.1 HAD family hydrolase [Pseudomonas sp. DY-1]MDH4656152.1 HAD family hydrolase [Pseudomonas sp. BN606]MRK21239.1 HAD family hydrolase [Pseudomonas sp. JG-B]
MNATLSKYECLVFDCDGVILDSNRIKTDAFYRAALDYGKDPATKLVEFHVANGGISRYKKFEHFFRDILNRTSWDSELEVVLENYANFVRDGLLTCAIAPGLEKLREITADSRWLIVSGGDQAELGDVFMARGLTEYFDGGIFGSPTPKDVILEREIERQNIQKPALFIGDSRFDHQCAAAAGLDFVFLSAWSEFKEWSAYFSDKKIVIQDSIESLLNTQIAGQA